MRLRPAAAAAACLLFAAQAPGSGLTDELKGRLDALGSGTMAFTQTVVDPEGKVTDSSGTLAYARPSRFSLEYETPDPVLLVSDGSTLWVHDVALNQVVVSRLSGSAMGQGFLSVLSATDPASEFELASRAEDGADWLVLTPRDEESVGFETCEIGFDGEGRIVAVRLTDLVGNKVDARFRDSGGPPPSAATFSFEPPDGAEVIGPGG